ncbi:MAG: TesB-like acyl-CoA thioesterase 5, partial [uncultured Blastococcus sp.]
VRAGRQTARHGPPGQPLRAHGRRLPRHRPDHRALGSRAAARRPAGRPAAPGGRARRRHRGRADGPAGLRHLRAGAGGPGAPAVVGRAPRTADRAGRGGPDGRGRAAAHAAVGMAHALPRRRRRAPRPRPAPRGGPARGQPGRGRRVLPHRRRLPPGAGVALPDRELQLAGPRVGVDDPALHPGPGRADDAPAAPAGHDRRGQRDLRGAGLDDRDLRQRRPAGLAQPRTPRRVGGHGRRDHARRVGRRAVHGRPVRRGRGDRPVGAVAVRGAAV